MLLHSSNIQSQLSTYRTRNLNSNCFFRFIPKHSGLAICELDEKHISVFNFRSRDGILTHLEGSNSLEKIRLSLLTQICQKHLLKATVDQLHACFSLIRKCEKNIDISSESGVTQNKSSVLGNPKSLLGK